MPPPDPATHADTVALFRYGLIADLLHLPVGDRSLHARLREKAAREYDIPGTLRRRVAAETLRDWLYVVAPASTGSSPGRAPIRATPARSRKPSPISFAP